MKIKRVVKRLRIMQRRVFPVAVCPPEGDGGDRELNRLKNRSEAGQGQYTPRTVAWVLSLTWPKSVERRARAKWTAAEHAAVDPYQGMAVSVEGYLVGAKKEGPEACNCHSVDNLDWHSYLVGAPSCGKERSVVVETTPTVRAAHPTWSLGALEVAARERTRVRISGWLLLDQEHGDQVGTARGTVWEIHPVTRIEMQRDGEWTEL